MSSVPRGIPLIFLIVISLALTSCKKKNDNEVRKVLSQNSLSLYEAKYTDLPRPVGYSFVNSYQNNNQLTEIGTLSNATSKSLCYVGGLSVSQATNFYRENMERLGWDIRDLSTENEGLLFCSKSGKSCAISTRIEGGKKRSSIHIFLQSSSDGLLSQSKDINSKQLLALS